MAVIRVRMSKERLVCRVLALFLLSLLAGITCGGDGSVVLDPEPEPPSEVPGERVIQNVTYCRSGGIDLKLDLHLPDPPPASPAPAALFLHGGGWVGGDKDQGGWQTWIRQPLVQRGFVVASANYRLADSHPWPAQIEDVKCAVRFLRAEADTYRIDASRIGVWGTSAGGHLAALLGTTDESAGFEGDGGHADQSSRVQAVVDLFGPADLTDGQGWHPQQVLLIRSVFGASDFDSPVLAAASPTTHATADDPPFLIVHGDIDDLVPVRQSELLYEQLLAAGVSAELIVVENAGHSLRPTGGEIQPSQDEIVDAVLDFFEAYLR